MPDDWTVGDELMGWCLQAGADLMLVEAEAAKFKDWAAAVAGQKGVKRDWDAAFRNWMRKALADNRPKQGRLDGFTQVASELARRRAE